MTAPLPDDELRAMLEARAGRVSPDAERSALAGFRAAVRGSTDGRGGFSVLPQALSSRGARLPWGVAALGMVAIVVVAVLGGRTTTADQQARPPEASAITPPASAAIASSATGESDPPSFEHLLAAGALRGQVVVIDGRLVSAACTSGVARRCHIEIAGWPGLRIVVDDQVSLAALDAATSESEARPLAFRVEADRALAFLGMVEGGVPVPLSGYGLARTDALPSRLVLARGRLVELKGTEVFMPCPSPASDGTGDACLLRTTHLLLDERPAPGGVPGAEVDLAPGVDPAALPEDGSATFLVRRLDGRWQVQGEQRLPMMAAPTR